jgi:hypothetical protein
VYFVVKKLLDRDQPFGGIVDLGEQGLDHGFIGGGIEGDDNLLGGFVCLHGLNADQLTHFGLDGVGAMSARDGGDGIGYSSHGISP